MAAYKKSRVLLFAFWYTLSGCGHFAGQSAFLWPLVERWALPLASPVGAPAAPAGCHGTSTDITGQKAFYPFSGNSNDGSGFGNHLAAVGSPVLTANRASAANSAYLFNGTDACLVSMNPSSAFAITDEVSASVWVYRTATNDQKVIGHFNDLGTAGWLIGVTPSDKLEVVVNNGWTYSLLLGSVPANTWTHLALTWKGGATLKGYVNGVKVSESGPTDTAFINLTGTGTYFFKAGCSPWNGSIMRFSGRIDDIRVYSREITEAEVLALCNLVAD